MEPRVDWVDRHKEMEQTCDPKQKYDDPSAVLDALLGSLNTEVLLNELSIQNFP